MMVISGRVSATIAHLTGRRLIPFHKAPVSPLASVGSVRPELDTKMASRQPQKARRVPSRKKAGPAELASAVERLEGKVKALQDERDALKEQLKTARTRISELEVAQTDAVNRIDWVIDSLHNLLEEGA